jgi:hypothetical protein
MPTRPRFTPANRPSKLGETKGCLFRFALLAAILFFPAKFLYDAATAPKQVPPVALDAIGPGQRRHIADPLPERTPVGPRRPADSDRYQNVVPTGPSAAAEQPQEIELATAGGIQRQQLAAGKFKQRQVIAAYDEVKRTLDEWEAAISTWEKEGPALLKSENGKRIAADETLTRRFRVVLGEERPSREQLSAARTAASDLIAPVRESESNPNDAALPNEGIVKTLQEIRSEAKKARDELRQATEQAQAILAQAGPTPDPRTLQEAIAAQVREDADARTTLIVAEVKKAEDEGNKRVAEEKAKAALAEKHRQAESILAESERQTLAAKAESERKTQVAKMAVLRQKARSPEVRRYLAPFLASGFSQPKTAGGNAVIFDKIGDEGPMSLTRIRNVGGLDKGERGIVVLNWIASSAYNDRTVKWNYGIFAHDLAPDSMRFIKTAQELLNELGDALVEEKLLAP